MTTSEISLPPQPSARGWRRLLHGRFLFISILFHLLLALLATYLVVQSFQPRKQTFQAGPKSPDPSTRAIEHKIQVKKQSTLSAPPQAARITTSGAAKIVLPDLPTFPSSEVSPAQMSGMGSSTGFGIGGGAMGGGGGNGPSINFFGLQTKAKRVAFLVDYSGSMDGNFRLLMEAELEKCLKALPPDTQVLIIPWAGGAWLYNQVADQIKDQWQIVNKEYDNFVLRAGKKLPPPEWVASSPENVQKLMKGVRAQKIWSGGTAWRSPFNYVMQASPPPDTIFFLTDGQIPPRHARATLDDIGRLLKKDPPGPKVFCLWIPNKNASPSYLKELAKESNGEFRAVGAGAAASTR